MFQGKKIRLRSYKLEDTERILDLYREVMDTLIMGSIFPVSYEKEREFIESSLKKNGDLYNFAIETLEGVLIGGCGINRLDRKNSVAEIGIWIGKDYHKKGYGSDSMRVLCKFIFDELNIHKIVLNCFSFNEKARLCYSAVGFKQEGIRREEIYRDGKYSDVIIMGLFRDELKGSLSNSIGKNK